MKGFTLIELIVAVGITVILGLVFTDVLTQALRGQNKVRVINQVKQNGQVVLDKLSNEIRQAERIICQGDVSLDTDIIVVSTKEGLKRFKFYRPQLNRNGYIAYDVPSSPILGAFNCDEDLSIINYLTDPDTKNGVSVDYDPLSYTIPPRQISSSDWVFKRDCRDGYNDMVTIKFRTTAGVNSGSAYETTVKDGGVLFQTTVVVRGGRCQN